MKKSVLLALSGGVDSCVCAHLLMQQGYDVQAVVMKMSPLHDDTISAAKSAAKSLNIPLTVLDLQEIFDERIISYFINEYLNGRTPNPCIMCNPKVKFKYLLETANKLNCDYIATGHYAITNENGEIYASIDQKRDQTYMLYRLKSDLVKRLVLPLGNLTKVKVREIAASLGLESADKPDSQENCFINGKDYASYILNRLDTNPVKGEFISPDGKVCGQHQGIIHYTIGQRRGLNIALGERVFIKEINPSENRIYLARQGENLYSSTMIEMVTTIDDMPLKEDTYLVKIRSTAKGVPAKIIPKADGYAYVEFLEPQTAVCSGQSLVIYTDDKLIGGGIINTLLK